MGKSRSPNYPAISLEEAIDRAKVLYQKDHLNAMSREVVVRHLGFGTINGNSLRVVSALRQYDLLEGEGDDLKLSSDAISLIVDQPGSQERREALQKCATAPNLFAELRQKYPSVVPSEENLRGYLQKSGFIPTAAEAAARCYRSTMELVDAELRLASASLPEAESSTSSAVPAPTSTSQRPARPAFDGPVVVFPLPRGNEIEIRLKAKVTQKEFEQLKQIFELLAPSIVELAGDTV